MTLDRPSESRDLPVRLCDVRADVRLSAAKQVADREPSWAGLCFAAALKPSTTTYYVSDRALPRLLRVLRPDALQAAA